MRYLEEESLYRNKCVLRMGMWIIRDQRAYYGSQPSRSKKAPRNLHSVIHTLVYFPLTLYQCWSVCPILYKNDNMPPLMLGYETCSFRLAYSYSFTRLSPSGGSQGLFCVCSPAERPIWQGTDASSKQPFHDLGSGSSSKSNLTWPHPWLPL